MYDNASCYVYEYLYLLIKRMNVLYVATCHALTDSTVALEATKL